MSWIGQKKERSIVSAVLGQAPEKPESFKHGTISVAQASIPIHFPNSIFLKSFTVPSLYQHLCCKYDFKERLGDDLGNHATPNTEISVKYGSTTYTAKSDKTAKLKKGKTMSIWEGDNKKGTITAKVTTK